MVLSPSGDLSGMRVRVPAADLVWRGCVCAEVMRGGSDESTTQAPVSTSVTSTPRPARKTTCSATSTAVGSTEYEIPADRATDGAFRTLYDRAEEQVRDLITEAARVDSAAPGTDAAAHRRSLRELHGRGRRRPRRLAPLLDELEAIDAADTPTRWPPCSDGCSTPASGGGAGFYIDTDSKNSSRYLLHFGQSGLGLPDESYYRDEQHAEILAAYPAPHRRDVRARVRRHRSRRSRRHRRADRRAGDRSSPPRTGMWSSAATPS